MKILITGIFGFIGMNLSEYLSSEEGITIDGMVKNKNDAICKSRFGVNEVYTFEELKDSNFEYDIIIHLAAKAHDLKNVTNDKVYFESNVELTKKLYSLYLKSKKPELFIHVSTVSVFSKALTRIYDESLNPNPITIYGKTKLIAEEHILNAKLPPGKRFVILRPSVVYGPYSKGNLNLLFKYIRMGLPYPLLKFENKRSFLSVNNFCFIVKEILSKEIKNGIYHVSNDQAISTNEIVLLIYNALGKKPRRLKIPKVIIFLLAKVGDLFNLPFNSERLSKLTEDFVVSNKKIKKELNIAELPEKTLSSLSTTFNNYFQK